MHQPFLQFFINDLAKELKLDIVIPFDKDKIYILHFADDIVLLAENESQLQKLRDFVNTWFNKWQMKINRDKTNLTFQEKICT